MALSHCPSARLVGRNIYVELSVIVLAKQLCSDYKAVVVPLYLYHIYAEASYKQLCRTVFHLVVYYYTFSFPFSGRLRFKGEYPSENYLLI